MIHHDHTPFGAGRAGRAAEAFARYFGTVQYLLIQTAIVAVWMLLNVVTRTTHWDPFPFILLNLVFSMQAAYTAPLILLAANRQALRDKAKHDADVEHRTQLAAQQLDLLRAISRNLGGDAPESIRLTVTYEDGGEGWVLARIREAPAAISQGRTRAEARANVLDALRELTRADRADSRGVCSASPPAPPT